MWHYIGDPNKQAKASLTCDQVKLAKQNKQLSRTRGSCQASSYYRIQLHFLTSKQTKVLRNMQYSKYMYGKEEAVVLQFWGVVLAC